jgi:hypothetical protein
MTKRNFFMVYLSAHLPVNTPPPVRILLQHVLEQRPALGLVKIDRVFLG